MVDYAQAVITGIFSGLGSAIGIFIWEKLLKKEYEAIIDNKKPEGEKQEEKTK